MNSKTTMRVVLVMLLTFFATTQFYAQVGIGTTNPASGSMLDIESTDKGILIPRVTLTGTDDITTITPGASYGLLVFNTATAGAGTTAVTEGFYYWDGTQWVRIQGEEISWKIDGNDDIINGTNFLGTLNNRDIDFRTNNISRFRIPGNQNQVQAMADGSRIRPFYSWNDDTSMGFWKSGAGQLSLSIDGTDFFNTNANSSIREFSINPTSDVMHFRIETDNEPNTFFVNGITDNVGLGTNAPNNSAALDMVSDNRGLLINRVILNSRDNAGPIDTPATGLLVYNTNTAGTAPNNVSPGFYHWDGNQWIAMDGTGGRDWSLLGNAGTNPSQNFIGTTDATDFSLRTNNSERLRASAAGMLGIATTPYANIRLAVDAVSQPYAILGTSTNGIASILGSDVGSGDGVRGESNTGSGVRGYSDAYHSVYALSPYSGPTGLVAASLGLASGTNLSTGVIGAATNSGSSNANIGIRAMSGSGQSISPNGYSTIGLNTNAIDLGLYALTQRPINDNTSISTEAAQFKANHNGDALGGDARDPQARLAGYEPNVSISGHGTNNTYYGGYFYSGGTSSGAAYAYVGARRGSTNFKVIGTGTVSTIVNGSNPSDSKKVMFAPEAPEVLFEDYGTGQLVNGTATINIDPIFSKNIHVSEEKPLKVFIQLEGDCNGVYVTNKSANGFTVKELQGGTSNVSFSWHIVANRVDEMVNGEKTVYQSLRFPDAPLKIEETTELSHSLKEDQKPRKATFEASQK